MEHCQSTGERENKEEEKQRRKRPIKREGQRRVRVGGIEGKRKKGQREAGDGSG